MQAGKMKFCLEKMGLIVLNFLSNNAVTNLLVLV